ncbi:hypothetical protein [Methylorubrum extorquens]|uniref:Uncharacterized protein n=1 Tax=Methylorubrum extorquens DSM 13060 TaxID=882800 RepID=H1KG99_METEX|nr:hypothetical protein [Methylorubrum extorquens]EHP93440.1 hypothetical protein MetexDRAFT_1661 [Methylorubrum extorquens DSM 13060]
MTDLLPLSQRVAAALTGSLSSADLAALIAEVSTETGNLDTRRAEAERVSLDPLSGDEAVEAASADVVRLGLAIRRQQAALQQLDERMKRAAAAERRAQADAARTAAVKQRDEAVTALRENYPRLAAEISDLMRQILSADRAITAHAPGEQMVEQIACGVSPMGIAGSVNQVGLLPKTVRLPALAGLDRAQKADFWSRDMSGV